MLNCMRKNHCSLINLGIEEELKVRQDRIGGGIGIYISKGLEVNTVFASSSVDRVECLGFEVAAVIIPTTHLHTHVKLPNQPGSNNVTVLLRYFLKSLRHSEEDLTIRETDSALICSICQNELDPKRNFHRPICDPILHKSCLKASLNNSQHCPNCQTNLPIEDIFGHILTRQQTRLLDSNKAVMANTREPTDHSQPPELTQQISEMVLTSVQAQQSKFLESLSVTMSEMIQKNIEEGLRKVNLPTISSMPYQAQSQSYFNLDFSRTGSISQHTIVIVLRSTSTICKAPSVVDNARNVLGFLDIKSKQRDRAVWDSSTRHRSSETLGESLKALQSSGDMYLPIHLEQSYLIP
uniref:RING-type domain-containing protein n=1 Tax=Glossina palpalis gambiensis TaxID=67801 RepID=A0A1B0BR33_9MUSC